MEPSAVYKWIGKEIARHRKSLSLTQAQLAQRVDLSRASIANIERGEQSILVHQLLVFAEALRCRSISELLPEISGNRQSGLFVVDAPSFNERQLNQIKNLVITLTNDDTPDAEIEHSDAT